MTRRIASSESILLRLSAAADALRRLKDAIELLRPRTDVFAPAHHHQQ
jgi:hypothetical protein